MSAWWEDAVVYEVYPRSFADADGDGVGDLPGLRSRLGYLADLGVDAVWLTPFYPSPLADGGLLYPGGCPRCDGRPSSRDVPLLREPPVAAKADSGRPVKTPS